MSKSATSSRRAVMAAAFLVLVITQMVSSAPALAYDYDNIRDLYEILLRQEAPSQFVHQMERKGGRSPTLRLRFGRRSDPLWEKMSTAAAASASNNDDGLAEKVPYK